MKHLPATLALLLLISPAGARAQETKQAEIDALKNRVEALEKQVAAMEKMLEPVARKVEAEENRDKIRLKARQRMAQDLKTYSRDQLREVESLYQVANKKWRSPEARESLGKLVDKFPRANRTGCAILYMGQWAQGEDKEKLLKQAIADHGDCYYGDGVQVGAYARYVLAMHYRESGKPDVARTLFEELKNDYPGAIDHRGNRLRDSIPAG